MRMVELVERDLWAYNVPLYCCTGQLMEPWVQHQGQGQPWHFAAPAEALASAPWRQNAAMSAAAHGQREHGLQGAQAADQPYDPAEEAAQAPLHGHTSSRERSRWTMRDDHTGATAHLS